MKNFKIPELVLPGGDLHRTEIAFKYGADAVYVGLDKYSLRKAEIKFTISEIGKAVGLAHKLGKKIYVTFNIFAHEEHLKNLGKDMSAIAKFSPDAFIISDPGIIAIAKEVAPKIPIHLSTQANTLNSSAVRFWQKQGVKRVVLGREASLEEIKKIKKALSTQLEAGVPEMELEVFVHGAMCISYSGRCLMSAVLTDRSANLGSCTQPCRWEYNVTQITKSQLLMTNKNPKSKISNPDSSIQHPDSRFFLQEPSRPGEYFEMEEDSKGTYLMSSKDLCLIEHIDELANAGVDALKIEGRNKTDYYVATVASAYRSGLDAVKKGEFNSTTKKALKKECEALTRRGYTTGFMFGDAKKGETFPGRQPITGKKYLGFIEKNHKDNWVTIVVKNKLEVGKIYEALTPRGVLKFKIEKMKDKSSNITSANPGEKDKRVIAFTSVYLPCDSFIRALK